MRTNRNISIFLVFLFFTAAIISAVDPTWVVPVLLGSIAGYVIRRVLQQPSHEYSKKKERDALVLYLKENFGIEALVCLQIELTEKENDKIYWKVILKTPVSSTEGLPKVWSGKRVVVTH